MCIAQFWRISKINKKSVRVLELIFIEDNFRIISSLAYAAILLKYIPI